MKHPRISTALLILVFLGTVGGILTQGTTLSELTITNGPLLLPDGTATAPSLARASQIGTGLSFGSELINFNLGQGTHSARITSSALILAKDYALRWTNTSNDANATADTYLSRSAAGILKVTTDGTTLGTLNAATINVLAGASSSGTTRVGGAVNANVTSVGNVGAGEDTLMSYTLPANAMDANGRGVRVTAWGSTANNANAKTLKLYFGAAVLGSIASTANQASSWRFVSEVLRTGAATQTASEWFVQYGTTVIHETNVTAPGETLSSVVVIKVTGEGVSNDDITQSAMIVEFFN